MKLGILLVLCCVGTSFGDEEGPAEVKENHPASLENLDFDELISKALENDEVREEVNKVYKTKYGNVTVIIGAGAENVEKIAGVHVHYSLVENFLKAFGQSIVKLNIDCTNITEDAHKNIAKLVSQYCCETLKAFRIFSCRGAFESVKLPFKKVDRVYFSGQWAISGSNKWTPNELFPALCVLHLNYPDDEIYKHHYKRLKELKVFIPTTNDFRTIVRNNPQIQQLHLQVTTTEVLKSVNESLNDLRSLEFHIPNDLDEYQGPVIEFESIKNVKIRAVEHKINLGKIKLNKVEQLTLQTTGSIDGECVEFIGGTSGLKTLKVFGGNFSNSTLSTLAENLSTLNDADITLDSSVDAECILKILKSNRQLKTLQFNCPGSEALFKELRENLSGKSKIVAENNDYSRIEITKIKVDPTSTIADEVISHVGDLIKDAINNWFRPNGDDTQNTSETTSEPSAQNSTQNTAEPSTSGGATYKSATTSLTFFVLISSIFVSSY